MTPRVGPKDPSAKMNSRAAVLGSSEMLWTREQCAAFLGISVRTLDSLPIPRAMIGGSPRFIPDVVRRWAEQQLSHLHNVAA
jgi:hypothetical protein